MIAYRLLTTTIGVDYYNLAHRNHLSEINCPPGTIFYFRARTRLESVVIITIVIYGLMGPFRCQCRWHSSKTLYCEVCPHGCRIRNNIYIRVCVWLCMWVCVCVSVYMYHVPTYVRMHLWEMGWAFINNALINVMFHLTMPSVKYDIQCTAMVSNNYYTQCDIGQLSPSY